MDQQLVEKQRHLVARFPEKVRVVAERGHPLQVHPASDAPQHGPLFIAREIVAGPHAEHRQQVAHAVDLLTVDRRRLRDGSLVLVVEDDGIGFDPASVEHAHGIGLLGMRERAALVGASLEIESTPGNGTSVFLRYPIPSRGGRRNDPS